jgi:hypothetical protein
LSRQCELAEVAPATVYRRHGKTVEEDRDEALVLCGLIDEEYTNRPFYGSRGAIAGRGAERATPIRRIYVQGALMAEGLAGIAQGRSHGAWREHALHRDLVTRTRCRDAVRGYLLRARSGRKLYQTSQGRAGRRPHLLHKLSCQLHALAAACRRLCLAPATAYPALQQTELSQAQPSMVISKLFKIAVQVRQFKNKIVLHLPSACAVKHLLQT